MTTDEFQTVLQYLVSTGDVYLPYGLMPGTEPGGIVEITTEEEWNAYGWNPPAYMMDLVEFSERDPVATPKLLWSVLESHLDVAMTERLLPQRLHELRIEGRMRVTAAYDEPTFYDEIERRLRHGHTHSQDLAREAIRARYRTLKNLIENLNYQGLKAFDVTDDALWQDLP